MTANLKIILGTSLGVIVFLAGMAYFLGFFESSYGPDDIVDKSNPKMIPMLEKQIQEVIQSYKKENCIGCLPEAYLQVTELLKSIKTIESKTRYGMNSSRAHNAIEVKVTFNSGRTVDRLYTGTKWNGRPFLGSVFLVKVNFNDGAVSEVLTNGIELTKDPSEIRNMMAPVLKAVVYNDIEKNPLKYHPAAKTKSDHKKAWDNL